MTRIRFALRKLMCQADGGRPGENLSRGRSASFLSYTSVCIVATALGFGSYASVLRWSSNPASTAMTVGHSSTFLSRDVPFAFPVVRRPSRALSVATDKEQHVLREVTNYASLSSSLCLHALHANGREASIAIGKTGDTLKILELFLDSELCRQYLGEPMAVRTAFGIRYPVIGEGAHVARGDASHRDQVLASLGELGVSLKTRITLNGDSYMLANVLADSIAEFHPGQKELAWTALAYGSYLSPRSRWTNKYGESFGFDELASALVAKELKDATCGGVHVLWAMTVVECVDHATPTLSPAVRRQLTNRITHALEFALLSQNQDGSWSLNWHRPLSKASGDEWFGTDSFDDRLLVTGHMAEWLQRVPNRLFSERNRISLRGSLDKASAFLRKALSRASSDQIREQFCPYTHAYCVVYGSDE